MLKEKIILRFEILQHLQVTSNYEAQDIDAHDLQMLTR
jgi:hypothetical protein